MYEWVCIYSERDRDRETETFVFLPVQFFKDLNDAA